MRTWTVWSLRVSLVAGLLIPGHALGQLKAVATLPDLTAILREVGGERVVVNTVGPSDLDPHYVPAKPSFLRHFRGAQLLVYNGLELEVGWLPLLLQGARNPRLAPGSPGVFSAGSVVKVLEVPKGEVSRTQGDIHPFGNPHIMLDPRNGIKIANGMAGTLAQLDPPGADKYRARSAAFGARLLQRIKTWERRLSPFRGREVVTYHTVWSYFFDWSGFRYAGVIEDKPGIPPAPAHVSQLMETMRARNVKVVFVAHYTPTRVAMRLAERAGARVTVLPALVGAEDGIRTYEDLFEALVTKVAWAFGS